MGGCAAGTSSRSAASESTASTEGSAADANDTPQPASVQSGSASTASSASTSAAPAKKRGIVCIDAGHSAVGDFTQIPVGPGASETRAAESIGTSGATTGTPEYEVNLEIALKLQQRLESAGFTVVMVRTSNDVSVSNIERARIAADCGAQLFIRLHCNGSSSQGASGLSTLVPGENAWTAPIVSQSQRAGSIMHPIIIAETGAKDDGIVERDDLAGFNYSTVPTVLFEMGFLTNPAEEQQLISDAYQNVMAGAIADATSAYFTQALGS